MTNNNANIDLSILLTACALMRDGSGYIGYRNSLIQILLGLWHTHAHTDARETQLKSDSSISLFCPQSGQDMAEGIRYVGRYNDGVSY